MPQIDLKDLKSDSPLLISIDSQFRGQKYFIYVFADLSWWLRIYPKPDSSKATTMIGQGLASLLSTVPPRLSFPCLRIANEAVNKKEVTVKTINFPNF